MALQIPWHKKGLELPHGHGHGRGHCNRLSRRHGFGSAESAVWQCQSSWQCNGFCSALNGSLAKPMFLPVHRLLQCPPASVWQCRSYWQFHGRQFDIAKVFGSAKDFAVLPAVVAVPKFLAVPWNW